MKVSVDITFFEDDLSFGKNYQFCFPSWIPIDRKCQQVPLRLLITLFKIMIPQNKNVDFHSEDFN